MTCFIRFARPHILILILILSRRRQVTLNPLSSQLVSEAEDTEFAPTSTMTAAHSNSDITGVFSIQKNAFTSGTRQYSPANSLCASPPQKSSIQLRKSRQHGGGTITCVGIPYYGLCVTWSASHSISNPKASDKSMKLFYTSRKLANVVMDTVKPTAHNASFITTTTTPTHLPPSYKKTFYLGDVIPVTASINPETSTSIGINRALYIHHWLSLFIFELFRMISVT